MNSSTFGKGPTALSAFSVVRRPEGRAWPWDLQKEVHADKHLKLELCATERALLNYLIARLHAVRAARAARAAGNPPARVASQRMGRSPIVTFGAG